ncbi:glycosyltransferase family 2 protein [Klebsiella spallanzanii]
MTEKKSISVIIPTIGRNSLERTLSSVLNQTYDVSQIIICYDGDDYEHFGIGINEICSCDSSKIVVINCGPFNGGNNARQMGIEIASSQYIALVDDDDEWLPCHISSFFEMITDIKHDYILYSSGAIFMVDGLKVGERPTRMKKENETFSEYIFTKKSLGWEHGFIQSSIMIFSKSLVEKVPFDKKLRFHQDVDWILRVQKSGLPYIYKQNPVKTVIYNSTNDSVSKKIRADQSFEWAKTAFDTIDKRCLGDFLLTQTFRFAKNNDGYLKAIQVIARGVYYGRPSYYSVALAIVDLIFPRKIKKLMKKKFLK